MEDHKPERRSEKWEAKLRQMARGTFIESLILLILGYIVYVGGSYLILKFVPDEQKAFIYQMILFQCLVMFMAVYKIYPKISMSTATLIESSRDTTPVFEDMARTASNIDQMMNGEGDPPKFVTKLEEKVDKATLDIKEEGRKIRIELSDLRKAFTKPIVSAMPKIIPATKVGNDETTNGAQTCKKNDLASSR